MDDAKETPLLDLARTVPIDYRAEWPTQWAADGAPTGHHMAPLGRTVHRLADTIDRLKRELASERDRAEQFATQCDRWERDIARLTRERDEARALAMHETEVARQEIRARTSAQNAKRAAEEAEIRCAAELDEALNILARHRGALMRIASGDAGDWKCHCPASEISNAELEEG